MSLTEQPQSANHPSSPRDGVVTPLFLLSLPRSGSTLVQRVLASHPQVATAAEPWVMIPLLFALRDGVFAEYNHHSAMLAIRDFCDELPGGIDDYEVAMADACRWLYARASPPGTVYFVDKTPRYHLIVDDLLRLFPEAKFVFLWRNPLAVAGSVIEGFGNGRWNLTRFGIDLRGGVANLVRAFEGWGDRIHAVRFEDLLSPGADSWHSLFEHLGIDFDPSLLSSFPEVQLRGRMGDHAGRRRYGSISQEPLSKWRTTLSNPLRKAWAKRYIEWIGRDRLAAMGYSYDELVESLNSIKTTSKSLGSDVVWFPVNVAEGLVRRSIVQVASRGGADRLPPGVGPRH